MWILLNAFEYFWLHTVINVECCGVLLNSYFWRMWILLNAFEYFWLHTVINVECCGVLFNSYFWRMWILLNEIFEYFWMKYLNTFELKNWILLKTHVNTFEHFCECFWMEKWILLNILESFFEYFFLANFWPKFSEKKSEKKVFRKVLPIWSNYTQITLKSEYFWMRFHSKVFTKKYSKAFTFVSLFTRRLCCNI